MSKGDYDISVYTEKVPGGLLVTSRKISVLMNEGVPQDLWLNCEFRSPSKQIELFKMWDEGKMWWISNPNVIRNSQYSHREYTIHTHNAQKMDIVGEVRSVNPEIQRLVSYRDMETALEPHIHAWRQERIRFGWDVKRSGTRKVDDS